MSLKLRRGASCVHCQERRVKCEPIKPCSNCVKAGVECRTVPLQPPRRRRRKPDRDELLQRLERYESLLVQHGLRTDLVNPQEDQVKDRQAESESPSSHEDGDKDRCVRVCCQS